MIIRFSLSNHSQQRVFIGIVCSVFSNEWASSLYHTLLKTRNNGNAVLMFMEQFKIASGVE